MLLTDPTTNSETKLLKNSQYTIFVFHWFWSTKNRHAAHHPFVYIFTEFRKIQIHKTFTGGYCRLFKIIFFYRCNRYWIFDCLRKIARLAQLCRYIVAWKTRFKRRNVGCQCRCHGILFVLTRFCFWAWMSRNRYQLVCCYG